MQIGTAYLFCPEAENLASASRTRYGQRATTGRLLTQPAFGGRPARGLINRGNARAGTRSAMSSPEFPLAGGALAPAACKGAGARLGRFLDACWAAARRRASAAPCPLRELIETLGESEAQRLLTPDGLMAAAGAVVALKAALL